MDVQGRKELCGNCWQTARHVLWGRRHGQSGTHVKPRFVCSYMPLVRDDVWLPVTNLPREFRLSWWPSNNPNPQSRDSQLKGTEESALQSEKVKGILSSTVTWPQLVHGFLTADYGWFSYCYHIWWATFIPSGDNRPGTDNWCCHSIVKLILSQVEVTHTVLLVIQKTLAHKVNY